MADVVHVSPEQIRLAGDEVSLTGESLMSLHHTCLADAETAQGGWIGSSAGALTQLLDRWATVSRAHGTQLGEHACGLHTGSARYTAMEQLHAAAFDELRHKAG